MQKIRITVLFALILSLNIALSGCLGGEEEEKPKEKSFLLELMGESHKIYAGDSTTYMVVVRNNREENDTVTLSIASKPSGWEVTLNQTEIDMIWWASLGIFVTVNASNDAKEGDHKVKIEGLSDFDGSKNSLTITTKVIKKEGERAEEGDKVEVDYFGYLVDHKIFDTSVQSIGIEYSILKTPDFSASRVFEPLKVHVGPEDPDPSDSYINTVEGFWEGIVGMKAGQSRTVIVPPSKGYGDITNTTINTTEEVTMFENMTIREFSKYYPYEEPIEGTVTKHHLWGWNITVDYVNTFEDVVRIKNEPNLHEHITPYGWDSEVIYKNQSDNGGEGRILVEHDAQVGMKAVYDGWDAEVISIENDQIKLEYNKSYHNLGHEVLTFNITLIEIIE
jgi:FKBP-type peptidyl-prolyl cis-trans isomerase 2